MLFKTMKTHHRFGVRKGQVAYSAHQVDAKRVSWKSIEKKLTTRTGISRAALNAVVVALTDIMYEELEQGNTVDLFDLGTFRLETSAKLVDSVEEVTPETIRKRIRFFSKRHLRELPKHVPLFVSHELIEPQAKKTKTSKPTTPSPGSGTPGGSGGEGGSSSGSGSSGGL